MLASRLRCVNRDVFSVQRAGHESDADDAISQVFLIRLQRTVWSGCVQCMVVRQRLVVASHQAVERVQWLRRQSPASAVHGQVLSHGVFMAQAALYSYTERKRIRKSFGKRESVLDVPYLLADAEGRLRRVPAEGRARPRSAPLKACRRRFDAAFPIRFAQRLCAR